jgi:hypothetical protein
MRPVPDEVKAKRTSKFGFLPGKEWLHEVGCNGFYLPSALIVLGHPVFEVIIRPTVEVRGHLYACSKNPFISMPKGYVIRNSGYGYSAQYPEETPIRIRSFQT